jgi:hypothetical protein
MEFSEKVEQMLKPHDWATVLSNLDDVDLGPLDEVHIIGTHILPNDENDVYNLRMHMVVLPVDSDGHVITDSRAIVLDPKHLDKIVDEDRVAKLEGIFKSDFGAAENEGTPTAH